MTKNIDHKFLPILDWLENKASKKSLSALVKNRGVSIHQKTSSKKI
jgi:hypothetical protein